MHHARSAVRRILRRLLEDPAAVEAGVEVYAGVHWIGIERLGFAAGIEPTYYDLGQIQGYRLRLRVRWKGTRRPFDLEAAIGTLPIYVLRLPSPRVRSSTSADERPVSRQLTFGSGSPAAATSLQVNQSPRSSSVAEPDESHSAAIESATASQAKGP